MTKEEAAEKLHLIKAFSEGKIIQFKISDTEWEDLNSASFENPLQYYRIKPLEPPRFFHMTKDEVSKILPVIIGFAEGKTVQFKNDKSEWIDLDYATFSGPPELYRIKPENDIDEESKIGQSLKIGQYHLGLFHTGEFWIQRDDGEGMTVTLEKFVEFIDEFWRMNFKISNFK